MKKFQNIISKLFIVAFLLLTFTKCNNAVTSNANLVFPASGISYQRDVYPFMMVKCAYSGCHGNNPLNGATNMSDYFSMTGPENLGLIVPNKPDNSLLNEVLEGREPHDVYTFPQNYIDSNQIHGMRQWVLEGAHNN
ncbi:MAG: hypothetical protein ABSG15_07760 [FCB group bacterium]|jgi:hypothetical protein